MRRAVVRAAFSACRVTPKKNSMLAVVNKPAAPVLTSPVTIRCFSQTFRVANEDAADKPQTGALGQC